MTEAAPKNESGAIAALAERVKAGDRRALARAITLIESTRSDHSEKSEGLLEALLPASGQALESTSVRIGITGVPGVGKSTFIECFGLQLVEAGHKVAVLAVDPSSKVSGGSILGDKTRMEELSRHPQPSSAPRPPAAPWAAWRGAPARPCWPARPPASTW